MLLCRRIGSNYLKLTRPHVGQELKAHHCKRYSNHRVFGSSDVKLSYNVYQPQKIPSSATEPLIILHGLLGSKQNWRSLGKAISCKSLRKVYTLDARNHGDSPHTDEFDYPSMALDVEEFMKSENIKQAVVMGHSMGGRTAMLLALLKADLVKKLIVVDVSPCEMPEDSSSVIPGYFKAMKEAVENIPLGTPLTQARKIAGEHLSKTIPDKGICQFLLTNLTEEKNNALGWKANIDVLERTFESEVRKFPVPDSMYNGETLFICGGASPYVRIDEEILIKKFFPRAKFIRIPGAGHWVHSEKPSEFLEALHDIL